MPFYRSEAHAFESEFASLRCRRLSRCLEYRSVLHLSSRSLGTALPPTT